MAEGTRYLILSLQGEGYAIPISRLLEITVPRDIQQDKSLSEVFEGKCEFRGRFVPVLNLKKIFNLPGNKGTALLMVQSAKGTMGLLVDEVTEIFDTAQKPAPVPAGVLNPSMRYYGGILRHRDSLVLLLNEDGLLP
jgi:chemotaxis signal transduction protein